MKQLLLLLGVVMTAGIASAQTNNSYRLQSGYFKPSTGKYILPHYKTNSNKTNWDNYSTKPNMNIWTGFPGTQARDYSIGAYNYGKGKTIHTGPKGGQYYYNTGSKRIYVPKRY